MTSKLSGLLLLFLPLFFIGFLPASAADLSPDSLYSVPFKWRDSAGKDFELKSLAGAPVVLTLAYTRCKTACPLTMGRIKRIAEKVGTDLPNANFIIVSLDPAHDTPETMSHFKRQYKLDDKKWHLLAGSEGDLRKLSVLIGYSYQQQVDGEIAHSNKIVALDSEGRITAELEGLESEIEPFVISIMSSGS